MDKPKKLVIVYDEKSKKKDKLKILAKLKARMGELYRGRVAEVIIEKLKEKGIHTDKSGVSLFFRGEYAVKNRQIWLDTIVELIATGTHLAAKEEESLSEI